MRVMLLAPGFSIHSKRFLQLLLEAGHDVVLVDKCNPKPEGAPRYKFVPYREKSGLEQFGYFRTANRLGEWLRAARLWSIRQRFNADIVHVHVVDYRAYYCVKALLHPLVLTCYGNEISGALAINNSVFNRKFYAQILSGADYITADAEEILEHCAGLVAHPPPMSLFYFGIDLDAFKPGLENEAVLLRQKLGIAPTTKLVLSIRRLARPMGQHEILRAFAEAIRDIHLDAVLCFHLYLPQSLEYEKEIKALAIELGVADRVIWLKEIEYTQMPVIYAMADVVINFPQEDGLPVSLFEAAACQRPVITSDLTAYREFMKGSAFTVVPSGDIHTLSLALRSMLCEQTVNMTASLQLNYELVTQKADQRKWFAKMEATYAGLIADRHHRANT